MDTLRFYHLSTLGDPGQVDLPVLTTFVNEVEPETWRFHKGEPVAAFWPSDARIYLTGEERGIELCELVGTTRNAIIASRRFKEMIQKHCANDPVEYLPLAIHDHRKRLLADEYFFVNPLGAHDCVDLEKSSVLWDNGPGSEVLGIDSFVIDRQRGSRAPQLFRPEHARASYVLRYELAVDIANTTLANVVWTKLEVSG
jgi:hypothetical protein